LDQQADNEKGFAGPSFGFEIILMIVLGSIYYNILYLYEY